MFKKDLVAPIMLVTTETYGSDLKKSEAKQLQKQLEQKTDLIVQQEHGAFAIQKNEIENQREAALSDLLSSGQTEEEVNEHFDGLIKEATSAFTERLSTIVEETLPTLTQEVVREVETKKKEHTRDTIEEAVRDHLRGFARTIPSFLMAYGDENTTLESFDKILPNEVFKEVTSISLDQFRLLRDGGSYTDAETGEEKYYAGNLFDPVVFNDSVKEFLSLKSRLADYFDESHTEDIFDYIPPQRTNQIYTPKKIVIKMVDMLEAENPGCFDDPDKTFIDLYMKSGLYITEIVKRLYNSENLKKLYPERKARLQHIFEKQVYGLAPTEIIYRIATSFILGFEENTELSGNNFRQADALPYAKEGTLNDLLDRLFGE